MTPLLQKKYEGVHDATRSLSSSAGGIRVFIGFAADTCQT